MSIVREAGLGIALAAMLAAMPASAQFFLKAKDLSGEPVIGTEIGLGVPLPDATPVELKAALVWNMRAALNVAALQCDFEPTLMTVSNYNAILKDHKTEIAASWDAIGKYFQRINGKNKAAGQKALDHFQTLTYSSFSPVSAQRNFCQTAHTIGREAIFTPRGKFLQLAQARTREMRNSLVPWGEQMFPRYFHTPVSLPRLDAICWSKKGEWVTKKCGLANWPPTGIGFAQR